MKKRKVKYNIKEAFILPKGATKKDIGKLFNEKLFNLIWEVEKNNIYGAVDNEEVIKI